MDPKEESDTESAPAKGVAEVKEEPEDSWRQAGSLTQGSENVRCLGDSPLMRNTAPECVTLPPQHVVDIVSDDPLELKRQVVRVVELYEAARTDLRYVLCSPANWGDLIEHLRPRIEQDARDTGDLIAVNLSTQVSMCMPPMLVRAEVG